MSRKGAGRAFQEEESACAKALEGREGASVLGEQQWPSVTRIQTTGRDVAGEENSRVGQALLVDRKECESPTRKSGCLLRVM